ncbi:hypothetical protein Efla_006141 [Eimeria flavescens]
MAQHEALRRPHRAGHPARPLTRRKALKHSSLRVSSAVQHTEQSSATAGTQQEVLGQFRSSSGTDAENSPTGKTTEVLAPAPAAVQPATEVRPLSNQPTSFSGPSAVTPSPRWLPATQQLSPVGHTAASTGTQTLVCGRTLMWKGVHRESNLGQPGNLQQPLTTTTPACGTTKPTVATSQTDTPTSYDQYELHNFSQSRQLQQPAVNLTSRGPTADPKTYEVHIHQLAGLPQLSAAAAVEPDPVHWKHFFIDF